MSEQANAVQVSEAVAAQLTAASEALHLGPIGSFQARHSLILPRYAREDFGKLVMATRPVTGTPGAASRDRTQYDYGIQVVFWRDVDNDNGLLANHLVLLAEKIADYWNHDNTTTNQTRTLTGRTEKLAEPGTWAIGEDDLNQHSVIKGVVNLVFRGWR